PAGRGPGFAPRPWTPRPGVRTIEPAGPAGTRPAPDRDPRVTNAPRPPSRLAAAYRRTLGRVPASVWKNVGLYAVGFGLLAVIVYMNWSAKPGKATNDQKALAFLAGAAADAEAQRAN